MKKHLPSFLLGCLSALLLATIGTTALAASGQITFNFSNVALNGETEITSGNTITAPNGQQVPGSILYTDAAGGKTNYLPIRFVSELLGVEVGYDSAMRTIYLGQQPASQPATSMQRWQREIDGTHVSYVCGEENHTYQTPPAWRPAWTASGWNLVKISHDTRNYTANWVYQNGNREISFLCAYPSTASFGRFMSNEDAVKNGKTLTIQGCQADYYQDGKHSILAWENEEGLLLYLSGTNVSQAQMIQAAESVTLCTGKVGSYDLGWLPQGYSLMDHYAMLDTVQEYWEKDGIALSWTYSAAPLGLPDGESETVTVNGTEAQFWAAEEPYSESEADAAKENTNGMTFITIPGTRHVNTLSWQDPDTGVYFRLQSIQDQDTMVRIATHVK